MRMLNYIKERWILLIFLLLAFLFALIVYRLDEGFSIRYSNAAYILMAWIILFLCYLAADIYSINSRIKNLHIFADRTDLKRIWRIFSIRPTEEMQNWS